MRPQNGQNDPKTAKNSPFQPFSRTRPKTSRELAETVQKVSGKWSKRVQNGLK